MKHGDDLIDDVAFHDGVDLKVRGVGDGDQFAAARDDVGYGPERLL